MLSSFMQNSILDAALPSKVEKTVAIRAAARMGRVTDLADGGFPMRILEEGWLGYRLKLS
ncbi:MAG: hypothetical protein AUI83_11195 [Armatimonadetes bacterium 13_1_40CM_3_65_7]|nr:MAG: hypothetical protein AUI83_11195 [Armatimonadetes bacterium 13_1_40CM_3_65_7]